MNSPRIVALALFTLAVGTAARAGGDRCSDPLSRDAYACREVVVEYDASFDFAGVAARHQLRLEGVIEHLDPPRAWFLAPAGSDVPALIDVLKGEPGVRGAERNREFVSPECRQWNVSVLELGPDALRLLREQPAMAAMHPLPAAVGLLPGKGVLVAVLDTGVSRRHPALAGRLTTAGIDPIGGSALADDLGDGIDQDGDGSTDRGWGHGTAVAGLVALVAPGARILPVRVLDDECSGTAFSFAAGIVAAVDAGAQVINASFGALDDTDIITRAVQYARDRDVAFVSPAGNGGGSELQFPARQSDAFAVAAVDALRVAPAFTAHSSKVALAAPGVDVLAPFRDGYAQLSGTSFSTAFVSGAMAVALGVLPRLDARAVLELVQQTATPVDDVNPALKGELGDGIPDLGALATAASARRRTDLIRRRSVAAGAFPVPAPGPVVLGKD